MRLIAFGLVSHEEASRKEKIKAFLTIFFALSIIKEISTSFYLPSPPYSNEPTTEYMVMRCIPESQRTFGLGIEFAIIRLFGSIPAPIIFGLVIDSTCQIWQEDDDASCQNVSRLYL